MPQRAKAEVQGLLQQNVQQNLHSQTGVDCTLKAGRGGQVRGLPCACVATCSLVWSKTVAFLSELGTAALAHAALQLSSMALQRTFCSQYSKYLVYCGLEKVLVEGHQPLRAGALNETLRADCTADCTFA